MSDYFTLYLNDITVNSIKIELLINALNIQPKIEAIALNKGQQRGRIFLELNPAGKVPVLVEGDFILTESNAILQWLASRYDRLWPVTPELQAQTLSWLFWQSGGWGISLGSFVHPRVVLPHWGFQSATDIKEDSLKIFQQQAHYLNQFLEGKKALVDNQHCIADICLGSYLIFAKEASIPLKQYPNISVWLQGLQATSWWEKTKQALNTRLNKVND